MTGYIVPIDRIRKAERLFKIELANDDVDLILIAYPDHEYFIQSLLGHCDCGRPDDSLRLFYKVLLNLERRSDLRIPEWEEKEEIKQAYKEDLENMYKELDEIFYNDDGLRYTFFYMLDKYELIEHGGSVHSGWLLAKGEFILEELKKLFEDEKKDDGF